MLMGKFDSTVVKLSCHIFLAYTPEKCGNFFIFVVLYWLLFFKSGAQERGDGEFERYFFVMTE